MAQLFSDESLMIIRHLAQGGTCRSLMQQNPDITQQSITRAAAEALLAHEDAKTRAYRVTDVRHSHRNAYKAWTPDEERRMLAMLNAEGQSIDAVAAALGRQPSAIQSRLHAIEARQSPTVSAPPDLAARTATMKALADRAGEHLRRVIRTAYTPGQGWILRYATMSGTDWPPVIGDGSPRPYAECVTALSAMIACFEAPGPDAKQDAAVRAQAEAFCVDQGLDHVFVDYTRDGYVITLRRHHKLRRFSDVWDPMPYPQVMRALSTDLAYAGHSSDRPYIGTGRDYGA